MWPPNGTKGVQEPSASSMPQRYLCNPAPARPPAAICAGQPSAAAAAAAGQRIDGLGDDGSEEEEEADGPGGSAGGGDRGPCRQAQVSSYARANIHVTDTIHSIYVYSVAWLFVFM